MTEDASPSPSEEGALDEAKKSDAAAPEPEEGAPRPKRKKKRAKAAAEPPPEREGVPAFARAFPVDPALDALVDAFEQGDYARVRREAPRLARETESDDVRAAARELVQRVEPDPLAVYLLAGAAVLLAFLAFWYWSHAHGAH